MKPSELSDAKVIHDVEAVPHRRVVDRSVLNADVDAGLGLATCERSGVGQIAILHPFRRSCERSFCGQTATVLISWYRGGVIVQQCCRRG